MTKLTEKKIPSLTENAKIIAEKRYLKVDSSGKPLETPSEMFERIAKFIATAENDTSDKKIGYKKITKHALNKLIEEFYEIQVNLEFLSGMSLLDRGTNDLFAACYVLPIHDSLESIYGTLKNAAILHRRGAGIGYDFSEVRPEGALIHSTGKEASGPISFMKLYDFSSEIIMNRGSVRHAGHMGILRIDHPDIEKFIEAKQNYSELTNFNISVAVTDEFLQALNENTTYNLKHNNKIYKKLSAKYIIEKIATSIYNSGEPGFIFIDEINRHNPTKHIGPLTATNQCGEQPLLPYEACNLGSIVLNNFLLRDKSIDYLKPYERINWKKLEKTITIATNFLDNTITISHHILPEIEKMVKYGNRKIGIGVMGWADLLYELEIPYNSNEALDLAEKIMKFITQKARQASIELGEKKGSFCNFSGSLWDRKGIKHIRNATVTTIAPNGTTSLLADCNGGIEPFFALAYIRKNMKTIGDKTELIYLNKYLEKKLKDEWLYNRELMSEIIKTGSIMHIEKIPMRIKKVFVTALDITPEWHIKMQAAFQKYTDNAVSKTINLPENTSIDKIIDAFKLAYKLHLKGLTIYRDKSRDKQVLTINEKKT